MTRPSGRRTAHVWRSEFPARQASLNRLLERFKALGRTRRMPRALRNDLHLVLDEMVSNVVHANAHRPLTRIRVELTFDPGIVTLEIVDNGMAFDPIAAKDPTLGPLEERGIGGLGIYLVKSLMDSAAYVRKDGRNHLRMTRKTRKRPAKDSESTVF